MAQKHGNIEQQNNHECQTGVTTPDISLGQMPSSSKTESTTPDTSLDHMPNSSKTESTSPDTSLDHMPHSSNKKLGLGKEQTRSVFTTRSVCTLRSVVTLYTFPGSGPLEKATYFAAAFGAFSALACTVAGYVWAGNTQDNTKEEALHQSACILNQLNFDEALAIAPWNFVSPQWIACIIFIVGFVVRKYLLPLITDAVYHDLTEMKKEKVSNYMLEIIGTTAGLLLCSLLGFWELLFEPEAYKPSAQQAYNIALGGNILMCCFITTYSLELAFDKNIRFGLALHHWTAMGLTLLALPALYKLGGDIYTVRAFFALSLYMSTEQNVFIEMLMYHRQIYWPRLYYLSAVYYTLTRLVITVLSLWTWRAMYDSVSTLPHQSGLVYTLWLVLIPANFVLNFTQAHTVMSLIGIARSVAKRAAACQPVPKKLSLVLPNNISLRSVKSNASAASSKACRDLEHTFHVIDFDDSGRITFNSWREHILGLEGDLVLPRSALNRSFDAMDKSQKGFVTFDEFEQFFEPFVIQSVDFERVMLAVVLKIAVESGAYGPVEAALRYEHSEVMSTIRQQYNEGKEHTMPAADADTTFQAALEKLGVQEKAGSLEDEILLQARELQDSFAKYCSDLCRVMPAMEP